MAQKKPKYSAFVSPVGVGCYVFIDKPSEPFDGKGDPQYKITLGIEDTAENRAWCDKVTEAGAKEAKANGVKLKKQFQSPFHFPEDQDPDDFVVDPETGRSPIPEVLNGKIFFNTKSKFQPARIDTARNDLPEDVRLGTGDVFRVKVELNPYEGFGSGISLRLKTVQLVEKNTSFGGGGSDTSGFDDIDGYRAPGESGGGEDDDEIPF